MLILRFGLKRSASQNTDNFLCLMIALHRIFCGCGGYQSCVWSGSPACMHFAGSCCCQTFNTLFLWPRMWIFECKESSTSIAYEVPDILPKTSEWFKAISGLKLNWLKAPLTPKTVCQGQSYVDNLLCWALTPQHGQRVVANIDKESLTLVMVYGTTCYNFFSFSCILSHLSSAMSLFPLCSFPQEDHPLSTHISIILLPSYVSSLSILSCYRTVSPLDYFSCSSHIFLTFHQVLQPSS